MTVGATSDTPASGLAIDDRHDTGDDHDPMGHDPMGHDRMGHGGDDPIRQRLLAAALEAFVERGYERVRVSDIAAASCVSSASCAASISCRGPGGAAREQRG